MSKNFSDWLGDKVKSHVQTHLGKGRNISGDKVFQSNNNVINGNIVGGDITITGGRGGAHIEGDIVGGDLIINGQRISGSGGLNVVSRNGKVTVNGVDVGDGTEEKIITVKINGNVTGGVKTSSGDVEVSGDADSVTTVSGDVNVGGCVSGSVSTVSGDVEALKIDGNVKTVSGDISSR